MSRPSSGKKSRHLQHEIEQIVRQEMTRLHGAVCHIADNSTITLSLAVRPGESSLSVAMDPPLLDQIRNQLRDLDVQRGVYRRGAVYCYLDESSECPHCRPDSPSHVMAEYLPNGIPEWRDLRDVLIDEHPALAAQLFETRDLTAAVYMRGRDIKHRLLSSFGKSSRTYNILGQIVCGFLTIHPSEISDHAVTDLALTIQAVETRDVGGQMNLGLNIISGFHDLNILDHLTMPGYAGFREKLIDVNRSLETIARDIRAAAPHRRNALIHTEMSRIP
nr:hypothetical protein [bacterium]